MDAVYGFYKNTASIKINLKEYFEKYAKLVERKKFDEPKSLEKKDNSYVNYMGEDLNNEDFMLLSEYCSVNNLTVPGEVQKCIDPRSMRRKEVNEKTAIPEDVDLQTLLELKKKLQTKNQNGSIKYRSEILIQHNEVNSEGSFAEPGQDILVYIRVYNPFIHRSHSCSVEKLLKISVNSVIVMLGSQTLAQLRDKITCISDLSISTDISDSPKRNTTGPSAKEVYKSGFFYIEDTFYNDFRDSSNIDYSEVIRKWAETRNLGPFRTASMDSVRIDSLSVKFGFPWVYQHQGNCEHLIVFSDVSLINSDDALAVSAYPRIHRLRPKRTRYCMMCGIFSVRWITTDNDRLPHNPCLFCDTCFNSYNYVDGEKLGNFKAYAYPFDPDLVTD